MKKLDKFSVILCIVGAALSAALVFLAIFYR